MNKNELADAVNRICLSGQAKENIIIKSTESIKEKEIGFMSKKKIGILAAAAIMVLGAVVYAASGIATYWSSYSSSTPEYDRLPTSEECIKEIGYAPSLVEEFKTGYTFKDASVLNNTVGNDEGVLEEFKSLMVRYEKDDDELLLSVHNRQDGEELGEVVADIEGIELKYSKYTNKFVTPDYEMTEEDKELEAKGEVIFSVGASEVYTKEVSGLSWEEDGKEYCFTQLDGNADIEDLVSMAEEIIKK